MSENTNKKIVLIDGHSILNRAFFGLPDLTNSEGLHTNAIYGFLTIMFKILDEEKPDYLTVAFDVHAPTFRHKMYDAYKGTRKPMADELRQQVPVIKEVLCSMGIKTIECAGLEADDLLGTLSRRCEEEGMEVSVISGDRDLLQLATQHVKIRIPKTKQGRTEVEDYYAADVKERYQVTPKEFIDLKALMGDTADNIPGVPSIGEKTATKIITEYHSIENAYEHVSELKPRLKCMRIFRMNCLRRSLVIYLQKKHMHFSRNYSLRIFCPNSMLLHRQIKWKTDLNRLQIIRRQKKFWIRQKNPHVLER